jgi:sec-independent protein translocase protein TatB
MLDIGWPEILVVAIVLIVVVGPKDLPPMLRAFGKMTGRLKNMAGEFRQQFDEALKDTEFDDVRKTISDAQSLNPVNSLKDAMNPLRKLGDDIRSDLKKAVDTKPSSESDEDADQDEEVFKAPEPSMSLPDTPPVVSEPVSTPVVAAEKPKRARKPSTAKTAKSKAAPVAADAKKPTPRKKTAAAGAKAEVAAVTPQPAAAKATRAKAAAAKPKSPKKTVAVKTASSPRKPAAPKKTAARAKKTSDA